MERWVKSMSEADEIYVLDTGSTDNSVKKLKELGVYVKKAKINPWRFDIARNESLKLVPNNTDICVCTDLDELFEPGWRKELEAIWKKDTTRLRYNYNWSLDENNHPIINFYIEKIHKRIGYKWIHPVHEVLEYDDEEKIITSEQITLNHYPDTSKSRSSYLPLLELSVSEDPNDDRNMHYLGREYMYYEKWNDAIDTLIKHLKLPKSTWKDERCASMRFIARCYSRLERYDEAIMWADKAILEAPYLREPYMERAIIAYSLNNWIDVEKYSLRALDIKKHPKTYINEQFCLDEYIYDLLSLSAYYQGHWHETVKWIDLALDKKPNDERFINNKKIFLEHI